MAATIHPGIAGAPRSCGSRRRHLPLPPAPAGHVDRLRLAVGMGWSQPLLRPLRISDHFDPARGAQQTKLLSKFLCAPRTAHLARLLAVAGDLLRECTMVRRTTCT